MKEPLFSRNALVVDRGVPIDHDALWIEVPVFIPISSVPLVGIVTILICETYRDAIFAERPQLFDEPVVKLTIPFASEKLDNLLPADRKLRAIAPVAIDRIGEADTMGITGVPAVLSFPDLLNRGF